MGYAVLKTTVKAMERDMGLLRKDVAHVYDLLRGMSDRIARIEGRLDA
jgi:ribosomal protein L22